MVQKESLHELEINFQMKTNANENKEMHLKSVKTKLFDFCKVLCLFFLGGHEYFSESYTRFEDAHQCQVSAFSHSSGNNLLCILIAVGLVNPLSFCYPRQPL